MARTSRADEWLTEDGLILIEGWARDGLTLPDIAHNMGIGERTLSTWKKRYPAISASLKKGKEVVDRIVENALFKRAVGYDYEEVTVITDSDSSGMVTHESTKTITKHVPGDTTAQIFWLQNRKTSDWRDKRVLRAIAETEDMRQVEEEVYGDGDSTAATTDA